MCCNNIFFLSTLSRLFLRKNAFDSFLFKLFSHPCDCLPPFYFLKFCHNICTRAPCDFLAYICSLFFVNLWLHDTHIFPDLLLFMGVLGAVFPDLYLQHQCHIVLVNVLCYVVAHQLITPAPHSPQWLFHNSLSYFWQFFVESHLFS